MQFKKQSKYWQNICLVLAVFLSLAGLAQAAPKGIATLNSFKGEVRIKSLGSWGVKAAEGIPLYHGDKILTGDQSRVRITFADGAILNLDPNGLVRIAHNRIFENELDSQGEPRREIRLLLGKLRYLAGTAQGMKTVLVAPQAMAVFKGKETWFGTDGGHAFIQGSGELERSGNITLDAVPEVVPAQTASDPSYQAALSAIDAWTEYEGAKQALEILRQQSEPEAYQRFSRSDKVADRFLDEEDEEKKARYLALRGELAKYAAESVRGNIAENRRLIDNPEPHVSQRAKTAMEESQRYLAHIQDRMIISLSMKQKLSDLESRRSAFSSDDTGLWLYAELVRSNFECNWAAEKSALARMMASEIRTVGLSEPGHDIDKTLETAKSAFLQAKSANKNAELFAKKYLDKELPPGTALKLVRIHSDAVSANAGLLNLVVNETESMIPESEVKQAERIRKAMEAARVSRDRIAQIVKGATQAPEDENALSADQKAITRILDKTESAADLYSLFSDQIQRRSMVLSPPIDESALEETGRGALATDPILEKVHPDPPEPIRDRDGDGWSIGEGDPDDMDPNIHGYHQ